MTWSPEDQDKALAWAADQADRCPGCNTPIDEATDPDLAHDWEPEPIRCFVCEARHVEGMRWRDEPEARRAGLLIAVRRRSRPDDRR